LFVLQPSLFASPLPKKFPISFFFFPTFSRLPTVTTITIPLSPTHSMESQITLEEARKRYSQELALFTLGQWNQAREATVLKEKSEIAPNKLKKRAKHPRSPSGKIIGGQADNSGTSEDDAETDPKTPTAASQFDQGVKVVDYAATRGGAPKSARLQKQPNGAAELGGH
jgi:L,D-peptidoglycan transpeptidase YkuD (ErfK/YbiS/YcfS/YnhG family)